MKNAKEATVIPWGRTYPPHLDAAYPRYSEKQIFCGPYLRNEWVGHDQYIQTSTFHFALPDVLPKIRDRDHLGMFISDLEVNSTPLVTGLAALNVPKIGKLGDTFHGQYPVSTLMDYLLLEHYDALLAVAQPAHLHFFRELGYVKCATLPRRTPAMDFLEPDQPRDIDVLYVGHIFSSHHVRRTLMNIELQVKLRQTSIHYQQYSHTTEREWLRLCSRSRMTICASLNNQFTPQIFYVMYTGTLCFIDELSQQTGLYRFFKSGQHLVVWRDFADLITKLTYYHQHPLEADAIAKAGQQRAQLCFPVDRAEGQVIFDYVQTGVLPMPDFSADIDPRCKVLGSTFRFDKSLRCRVRFYEILQDFHRRHESVNVLLWKLTDPNPAMDIADLPRLNLTSVWADPLMKAAWDAALSQAGVTTLQLVTPQEDLKKKYEILVLDDIGFGKLLEERPTSFLTRESIIFVFTNTIETTDPVILEEGYTRFKLPGASRGIFPLASIFLNAIGIYVYDRSFVPSMQTTEGLVVYCRSGRDSRFGFCYSFRGAVAWWQHKLTTIKRLIKHTI